jgi:hypothetical protein
VEIIKHVRKLTSLSFFRSFIIRSNSYWRVGHVLENAFCMIIWMPPTIFI